MYYKIEPASRNANESFSFLLFTNIRIRTLVARPSLYWWQRLLPLSAIAHSLYCTFWCVLRHTELCERLKRFAYKLNLIHGSAKTKHFNKKKILHRSHIQPRLYYTILCHTRGVCNSIVHTLTRAMTSQNISRDIYFGLNEGGLREWVCECIRNDDFSSGILFERVRRFRSIIFMRLRRIRSAATPNANSVYSLVFAR